MGDALNNRENLLAVLERVRSQSGVLNIRGISYNAKIGEEIGDVKIGAEINKGSCGTVYECVFRGENMAMKKMALDMQSHTLNTILMDLEVIRASYECDHIVKFYGYFITDTYIGICMEKMAICFHHLLDIFNRRREELPEAILGKMCVSVVNALHYLKSEHDIMHRDIKPSNILLNWNGIVKLCDFGISKILVESRAYTRNVGCRNYLAPERINAVTEFYDVRSDVWSFGITLVELANGEHPYSEHLNIDYLLAVAITEGDLPRLRTDRFTPEFCDFVERCLQRRPEDRDNFEQLLNHPFIIHHANQPTDMEEWHDNVMEQA